MSYEQPNPITVAPSSLYSSLAPPPRPDFYSRTAVSDLPTEASTHIKPPKISKRGLYKDPSRTTIPGPGYPKQKALTKKLHRTPRRQPPPATVNTQIKFIRNGVVVKPKKEKRKKERTEKGGKKRRKKSGLVV